MEIVHGSVPAAQDIRWEYNNGIRNKRERERECGDFQFYSLKYFKRVKTNTLFYMTTKATLFVYCVLFCVESVLWMNFRIKFASFSQHSVVSRVGLENGKAFHSNKIHHTILINDHDDWTNDNALVWTHTHIYILIAKCLFLKPNSFIQSANSFVGHNTTIQCYHYNGLHFYIISCVCVCGNQHSLVDD